MAKASTTTYGNDSISMLKGAERVRKRPSVIFGSDGLEGCEHAVFEILSNAIDEAREGFGNIITVTRYEDKSIEVEDLGRGCPVDWNEKEQRYNWELIFCEMYAGGKYKNNEGEMLGGTELIRRKLGKDAHAMTITLLLNSEGKKMGKTQSGAVWLDPNKTTPFEFYQYWRNVGDADVLKCLRMLTFLPLEQIDEMDKWEGSQLNQAKEILAYELTSLVHGEEEAKKAQESARALFAGGAAAEMPTAELSDADLSDGSIDLLSIVQKSGLCASRSEARRNVEQGGVSVDGEIVKDIKAVYTKEQLSGEGIVVKRGKKNFRRVVVK